MTDWRYRAFGLELESSFALPGIGTVAEGGRPDIALRLAAPGEVARRFSGASGPPLWQTVFPDGCTFRVDAGALGDRLFTYGERATFHLWMAAGTLICEPAEPEDPAWQRQLLDTVLLCASHLRGFELLHASAVECPEGVVAIAADTGGGKTSLAAELVRRGNPLFADDIVALGRRGRGIVAHPAPPVMNLAREQPGADEIGTPIATFDADDETWIAVHGAAAAPADVAAIFLLDRRPHVATHVEPLAPNALHLLPHSVGFHNRPERQRIRFELLSDLAATTPILRLRADVEVPPAALADAVERTLAAPGEAAAIEGARA
jgi:hypothetical protein